jgi:hypothetical protein
MSEQIEQLESRLDQQEQYSRIDNGIISGLKTQLFSSVTSNDRSEEQKRQEYHNMQHQVLDLFNRELGVQVEQRDISTMHYLPTKNQGPKNIIVRFVSRTVKNSVMINRKKLKARPEPVYISEHLTDRTSKLAYEARRLKRDGTITNTWTKNCKVMVETQDSNNRRKVTHIKVCLRQIFK